MSRFYDVLRQAGRSSPNSPEEAGATELRAFPAEVEEILRSSNGTEASATDSAPVAPSAPAPEVADLLFPADAHSEPRIALPEVVEAPASEQPDVDALIAVDEQIAEESPRITETQGTISIPPNGSSKAASQICWDVKARLLSHAADAMIVEHYRLLRTKLLQAQADRMFRSLLVTSPGPEEGKTVTTVNLAMAFAMLPSFKVLVVEGDLRRGNLGKWLGIKDHPGLSDFIEGSVPFEEAVLKSSEVSVSFLVRGQSRLSAAELLHSPQLKGLLQEMAEQFDLVLVDSPPVNLVADAQLLAAASDAVLLVARAFATSQKGLGEAHKRLLPFHVIGTVLNGGTSAHRYYGYRSYY